MTIMHISTHSLAYLPFLQRGEEEGKGREIGRGKNASVWMEVVRRSEEEGGGGIGEECRCV